jgi:hypothetical protein
VSFLRSFIYMARSCTPPPLSDRKKPVADVNRRQSLAFNARPSNVTQVEDESTNDDGAITVKERLAEMPARSRSRGRREVEEPVVSSRAQSSMKSIRSGG